MADRNKFEEMLERLINEDRDGAEELFHEIVVEKSRDIYEGLLESDLEGIEEAEDDSDDDDEDMEEGSYKKKKNKKDDDEMSEDFDLDEFEVEGEDDMDMDMDMDMGGDATDDMLGDIEDGDEEEEDEDEDEEMEDRVEDLEDALDDLKAEFEKMMAGEDGDEEDSDDDTEMDMDMDMDSDDDGEEGDEKEEALDFGEAEEDDDEEDDEDMSEAETMREYVEKVTAKMGDDGVNTDSPVASANDMGGEAGNIAQGGEEKGGSADSPKEEDMGNVNVPGGKASKSMKAQPKGHGAEKKGAGDTAANKKSTLGS